MENYQTMCEKEKGKEKNTASTVQTQEWEENSITGLEWGQCLQDSLKTGEFPANASL